MNETQATTQASAGDANHSFSALRLFRKIVVLCYGLALFFLYRTGVAHIAYGAAANYLCATIALALIVCSILYSTKGPVSRGRGAILDWIILLLAVTPLAVGAKTRPDAKYLEKHHHHSIFEFTGGDFPADILTRPGPGMITESVKDPTTGRNKTHTYTKLNLVELGNILIGSGDRFIGNHVAVRGIIYPAGRRDKHRFMLARLIISCCEAHADQIDLPIDLGKLKKPNTDSWVLVYGTVQYSSEDQISEEHQSHHDKDNNDHKDHQNIRIPYHIRADKIESIPNPSDPNIERCETSRPFAF